MPHIPIVLVPTKKPLRVQFDFNDSARMRARAERRPWYVSWVASLRDSDMRDMRGIFFPSHERKSKIKMVTKAALIGGEPSLR